MRSFEGSFIDAININRLLLTKFLLYLPDETEESVRILMNPADHQNVPRAVKLIQAVIAISQLDPTQLSITEQLEHRAFRILAALWDSFLQPFIHPAYSLSDQLSTLSCFAHLAYALYILHGRDFMANHLYSDMQALVKAAFTCIARSQILDPTQKFYLYQLGSDRLEELFAEVRTQTHDRNCDVTQLADRLSISADMVEILDEYSEWDRGHRRRSFSGKDVDHVNPRYFTGDLVVGNVSLPMVWEAGRIRAETILRQNGIVFNILEQLERHGGDFLCPRNGRFPGKSSEKDRSVVDPDDATFSEDSIDDVNLAEPSDLQENAMEIDEDTVETEGIEPAAYFNLENMLDINSDGSLVTGDRDESPADWLALPNNNGGLTWIHKMSVCEELFNKNFSSIRVSVDRLRRVRGFSRYTETQTSDKGSYNENDDSAIALMLRDIALVPLRVDKVIALALIKVVGIESKGKRVAQISENDLDELENAKVVVSGQVLEMKQPAEGSKWLWTGGFVRFASGNKTASSSTDNGTRTALVVKVPGHLVQPLEMHAEAANLLSAHDRHILDAQQITDTYGISGDCLDGVISTVYDVYKPASIISSLSKLGGTHSTSTFPYCTSTQQPRFILTAPSQILNSSSKDAQNLTGLNCHQCGKIFKKPTDLRGHVGEHILRAEVGCVENDLLEQVRTD